MPDDPEGFGHEDEGESIECWCGAKGTYEELFDESGLPPGGCGGSGTLLCECGGDQCVCHFHGEADCPGCEDCREGVYEIDDGCDYCGSPDCDGECQTDRFQDDD